ncbi:Glycosyltransferase involved in cell wall bisynthesis [Neorhodopirellula lusitana]|uniref:Glycosyltransferase involved in cell wall bisynthesis n=2 Tax=Neorhodopirellula lusitana TaxID=445327 RepID=A0ABY1QPT4_9BACT|nr:Glycosyltransferase involved in cell wall bisynthesis [Neorhodopirellula lusitana]
MIPTHTDSFAHTLTADEDCPATVRMFAPPAGVADCEVQVTQTLRVLHVVNGEHFSGAERVQSHLGRCLPEHNVTADFACVKPGRFAEMLEQRDKDNASDIHGTGEAYWGECHRVPMRGRADLFAVKRLADVVHDGGYEVMHAHTPRTAMLAALVSRKTGVPWIYHVHSPAARDCERMLSNRINAWIERKSLSNCSHLICVSNSLREDLIRQGFAPDKITVVHNGVPAIRPAREVRPEVGGRWTIGMIALMRNRKGLEVVLDALSEVHHRGLDVVLRCIGPFETEAYRQKIDDQIEELQIGDQIEWVGFTDDVPAELARLDAMVLPSLFGEGLPMVVLEAMAAAVPVIATRVEGTPEAITHGVEGLLAEPRDAMSLADQIEALVTGVHDWNTMAEAAADRHGACFSDHAMAKQTADVYRRVVDAALRS